MIILLSVGGWSNGIHDSPLGLGDDEGKPLHHAGIGKQRCGTGGKAVDFEYIGQDLDVLLIRELAGFVVGHEGTYDVEHIVHRMTAVCTALEERLARQRREVALAFELSPWQPAQCWL